MPSDVDAHDERLLIEDARQAVKELDQKGIFTYCISLDPKADEYVSDIFAASTPYRPRRAAAGAVAAVVHGLTK